MTVNATYDFQADVIGLSCGMIEEHEKSEQVTARNKTTAWRGYGAFIAYVGKRFVADQCTVRAAGLTYTSLLALVPLLAISFAIFSAFPAFDDLQIKVQVYIFENFVPQVGETVAQHLEGFTKQTGKLTAVGIVFLVATSIMLLLTISNAFDAIWRVQGNRTLVGRLLVYWAVLTLAPLLLGANVSLSGYLFTAAQASGVERFTGPLSGFARFLPLLFQFGGFAVLYLVMPNTSVRIRDALVGGFTAALLFEILKKLFGYYVTAFPTYETIYGALATFPIFLIWMYISWLVVLIGAELCAAMPEWRLGQREPNALRADSTSRRLQTSLSILYALSIANRTGRGLSAATLSKVARPSTPNITKYLSDLEAANFIAHSATGDWTLTQDLELASLHDLSVRLGLQQDTLAASLDPSWLGRYTAIQRDISRTTKQFMDVPIKSILNADQDVTVDTLIVPDSGNLSDRRNSRRARILAWIGLGWLGSS